jgi:hypothetical protein
MNINDIISLDSLRLALRRWHVLVIALCVSLVLGTLTYSLIPRKYWVSAIVIGTRYESDITPNNQTNAFSAAALLGGSINDLPNINDFRLYTQLLTSPELGTILIDDPLMHQIFEKQWQRDHWAPPDTFSQHLANTFFGLIGQKAWSAPDGFTVARYLTRHISITAGKDAKVLNIGIWTPDPDFGKTLLSLVNLRADDLVKGMAQKRFKAKVEFLEKAISTADVEETRTALGEALAKAETDQIYSLSSLPFAAEFLAPPDAPSQPQFPDFIIVISIFVTGGVLIFLFDFFSLKQKGVSLYGRISNALAGARRTSRGRSSFESIDTAN